MNGGWSWGTWGEVERDKSEKEEVKLRWAKNTTAGMDLPQNWTSSVEFSIILLSPKTTTTKNPIWLLDQGKEWKIYTCPLNCVISLPGLGIGRGVEEEVYGNSIERNPKLLSPGLMGWRCQLWNAALPTLLCLFSPRAEVCLGVVTFIRGLLNDRIIQLHTSPQLEKGCLDSNWPWHKSA